VDALHRLEELARRGWGSLVRSVRAPGGVA
jgi:hypothetical protein